MGSLGGYWVSNGCGMFGCKYGVGRGGHLYHPNGSVEWCGV